VARAISSRRSRGTLHACGVHRLNRAGPEGAARSEHSLDVVTAAPGAK
jgi:hypothetical protein